jgi:hypothetical protein
MVVRLSDEDSIDAPDLIKELWKPYFKFSEVVDSKKILDLIDHLIMGCPQLSISPDNWIVELLMGRHNFYDRQVVEVEVDKRLVKKATKDLNTSQKIAIFKVLTSIVSLVEGPPGTGKTLVLAVVAILCAFAGKRIVILSKTNAAILEALRKALELLRKFGFKQTQKTRIMWLRGGGLAETDWDTSGLLEYFEDATVERDDQANSLEDWASTAIKSGENSHDDNENSVRNIIRYAIKDAKARNWVGGEEVVYLRRLYNRIEYVRVYLNNLDNATDIEENLISLDDDPGAVPIEANAPTNPIDLTILKRLVKELNDAYEDTKWFFITFRCNILLLTLGQITQESLKDYGGQVLLYDKTPTIPIVEVIAGLRKFAGTLKRVVFLGE